MRYVLLLALLTTTAAADGAPPPTGKLVDRVVQLANDFFDRHIELLTHDMVQLRVDADHREAKIAVGGGHSRLLKMRVAGTVEVVDGTARIKSRVALALAGKQVDVRLPNFEVVPSTYPHRFSGDRDGRFERGVEVRMPLLLRSF
jgi:hypothetical protein